MTRYPDPARAAACVEAMDNPLRYEAPRPSMTAAQFRACVKALGFSPERCGMWLGLTPEHGRRYAAGEEPIPEPVAMLIRLVERLRLDPSDVG